MSSISMQRCNVVAHRVSGRASIPAHRRATSSRAPKVPSWTRSSASTDVASTTATVVAPPAPGLTELNQTNFYPILEAAGDSLVVVDFYTDWCGPCKMIYPDLVKMSEQMSNVKFYKLNCNKSNKDLGKKLQIRVAPTFHLYKRSEKVAEMTGAKVEKLRSLIEEHM